MKQVLKEYRAGDILPRDAELLCVKLHRSEFLVHALVQTDTENQPSQRRVTVLQVVPGVDVSVPDTYCYFDTIEDPQGLVWHVFDDNPQPMPSRLELIDQLLHVQAALLATASAVVAVNNELMEKTGDGSAVYEQWESHQEIQTVLDKLATEIVEQSQTNEHWWLTAMESKKIN